MRKNIIAGVLTVAIIASFYGLALLVNKYPEEVTVISLSVILCIIAFLLFKIIKSKL